MSTLGARVSKIERLRSGGGSGIFAVWAEYDEPLYSDCFGDERQYFSYDEFITLYPDATVIDFRELNKALREAQELKRERDEQDTQN